MATKIRIAIGEIELNSSNGGMSWGGYHKNAIGLELAANGAAILNCGGAWRKLVPAFGGNE